MIRTSTARLPADSGEDRLFVTSNSVIVLDGATSYGSVPLATGSYVDHLGNALMDAMDESSPLRDVLASALHRVTQDLRLDEGSPNSPSSTVAIARIRDESIIDLLVLGDSTVVIGTATGAEETLRDERLTRLRLPQSQQYRSRLRHGGGYDNPHRAILADLQREQRKLRNQPGGYWIASTTPEAAHHAITDTRSANDVEWLVLATDGATDTLPALDISWKTVAQMDKTALERLLIRCHQWEEGIDPDGILLPRPKRHDDKAIAVVRLQIPRLALSRVRAMRSKGSVPNIRPTR